MIDIPPRFDPEELGHVNSNSSPRALALLYGPARLAKARPCGVWPNELIKCRPRPYVERPGPRPFGPGFLPTRSDAKDLFVRSGLTNANSRPRRYGRDHGRSDRNQRTWTQKV